MSGSQHNAQSPAVLAESLSVSRSGRLALWDVSLTLERGDRVALIGPNGSGKTTFMNAIAGLDRAHSGQIHVLGEEPGHSAIAYVFQATHVPAHLPLTVREVVRMGRYRRNGLTGRIGAAGRDLIERSLERVALSDLANRQLQELSGGQRQRVLVAQGLAAEAELLMLDEPMTGLDAPAQQRILGIIDEEAAAGRTVIFSTHDISEAQRADHVVLLAGRLVSSGPPKDALGAENLRVAYRSQFSFSDEGPKVIDDAHHHHHDHHHDLPG